MRSSALARGFSIANSNAAGRGALRARGLGNFAGGGPGPAHGALGATANGLHSALHAVPVMFVAFARRTRQIVSAVGQVVAGFFPPPPGKKKAPAHPQPPANQET